MARKTKSNPTAETLKNLEETGDRVAEWSAENAALILGAIAAVLVIAGVVGLYVQHASNARDAAADSLAIASSQYRSAMGADPVGGPIPEPANAELGERTRSEFVDRFLSVAVEHAGTTAGALAWLEAGQLQTELGRLDAAAASFERARENARGTAIAALGAVRLASLAEDRGDAAAAAQAFEAAAAVKAYPLRAGALADAARCWVQAGQNDKALSAFQRLEADFPEETVPPHISALIEEIRLAN